MTDTLFEINNLSEIKTNGYYRFGSATVVVDYIGLTYFQNFVMPPVRIIKPNGDGVQLMIDQNGKLWYRSYCNGSYTRWINPDEGAVDEVLKDTVHWVIDILNQHSQEAGDE